MTICMHELRRGRLGFWIWTGGILLMILVCMMLYPEMKAQMAGINALFANMGMFTAAFGMDIVNFGEAMGFYAIECGNILGLGGSFFAAILGITALAKEEQEHTAEFLLAHPVSRQSAAFQKWAAVVLQLILMNLLVVTVSAFTFQMVGESVQIKEFLLLHAAYLLLQIEIASVSFGISAFLRGNAMGLGLGLATVLYFLNLIKNISDQADFLKYFTPFSYAEAAEIVGKGRIDGRLAAIGLVCGLLGVLAGIWHYTKKDIVC